MQWQRALQGGNAFREAAASQPGWYWVFRPKNNGPQSYDPRHGVMCLVHVSADGELLSPLADFRSLSDDDLKCHDASHDVNYVTWFAGPVVPGDETGSVVVERSGDQSAARYDGDVPRSGSWAWCRTNEEAPLLLVDEHGIGPIFVESDDSGDAQVFLASDANGRPVDVGEFGFAEPLVSEGGVIDASGQLGRVQAIFYGVVDAPAQVPDAFPMV